MATWQQFEDGAPDLAVAGWKLLTFPGVGFGYLATVRPDGTPRIHPVNPIWVGGMLALFVVPSPKLADLRRNGRYALHSCGAEGVNDEFLVIGGAAVRDGDADAGLRTRAVAGYHGPVADDHVLVTLDMEQVLWAHYGTPPSWPPTYRRWPERA
jgi:hypothetical protein